MGRNRAYTAGHLSRHAGAAFTTSRIRAGNRCVSLLVYDDNGAEVVGAPRVLDCENSSTVSKQRLER